MCALEAMDKSLRDLGIFWEGQVQQLKAVVMTESPFPPQDDIAQHLAMWRNTRSTIPRVVSSISASSDAVQVCPVGEPPKYSRRKQGFLAKILFWSNRHKVTI